MADDYSLDLNLFPLERFRDLLATKELLPGRMILKEQLEERFAVLEARDIGNLQELADALKNKDRLAKFAEGSGLPEDYLTILRRETNRYISKAIPLTKLPDIDPKYLAFLEKAGIKTTKQLFARARTPQQRAELADQLKIPSDILFEWVKLSDLVRVVGVGPVFARILYEAGIDTVECFASHSTEEILAKLQAVSASRPELKTSLTDKDIDYCFETAAILPKVIE